MMLIQISSLPDACLVFLVLLHYKAGILADTFLTPHPAYRNL